MRDYSKDEDRTIFKLRLGRKSREASQLGVILMIVLAPIVVIGLLQLIACKHNHPDWAALRCVRPDYGHE